MVTAIVGANWGDEGKGKITDMLGEESDVIVRFQGGSNAGHTIINDYGKFALHLDVYKRQGRRCSYGMYAGAGFCRRCDRVCGSWNAGWRW